MGVRWAASVLTARLVVRLGRRGGGYEGAAELYDAAGTVTWVKVFPGPPHPPAGSLYTAALSVFKDGACSVPLLGSVPISSSGPACHDLVPAGLPLGSKTVTALAHEAGSCRPSGGDPAGTLKPSSPSTFCCLMS